MHIYGLTSSSQHPSAVGEGACPRFLELVCCGTRIWTQIGKSAFWRSWEFTRSFPPKPLRQTISSSQFTHYLFIPSFILYISPNRHLVLSNMLGGGSDGKESACSVGDLGSISRLGKSPGEWNGYPLQYSGLENFMDSGAWQAIYSSWGRKDTTEQLSQRQHNNTLGNRNTNPNTRARHKPCSQGFIM